MKDCTKCKLNKPLSEFSKWHSGKLQPVCKICNRKYQKAHYEKNKQRYIENVRGKRNKVEEQIRKIKEATPCADCEQFFHYCVMDFDHLRDKKFQISKATRSGFPLNTILNEIDKCELVCANCHRIRSFARKMNVDLK